MAERFQTKIKAGQKAQVSFDALPGRQFTAVVQAIDPLIDSNGRSIGVRGCIDNRQMQLRPGMFARVSAVFGERENALVIPEEAIVPQGGRTFVVKVVAGANKDEQISERVAVKIGLRQPGKVEVLEGLALGDTVVIAGQQRLQKDGTLVKVLDLSKAPGANPGKPGEAPTGKPAESAAGKPADKPNPAARPAAANPAAAKPMAGDNPCLRGLNATR